MVDSIWRLEGAAVLAWAIGRFELTTYDELVDVGELFGSLGFMDIEASSQVLAEAELRPREEIANYGTQMLALHWRVRNHQVNPGPVDFVEFSRNNWFGGFDISPFRVVNGDLALGKYAFTKAPRELLGRVSSLAHERHLATNWLAGYSRIYSETDTST
jgi:hypothetical protein